MGQAARTKIPVKHQPLRCFKSLLLKPRGTYCTSKCQSFFRMRFRYQNPSGIFERLFFKPCLSHVSHLQPPDSILPLPSFSTVPQAVHHTRTALFFFFFLQTAEQALATNCILQNVMHLCVFSSGHSFWWDTGSGWAGAWDGDRAHRERCCAGGGYPGDIPLLQHVSLVQGWVGWCVSESFILDVL